MPSIYGNDNPGPGALPTFPPDLQQSTRVREFQGAAGAETARVFGDLSNQLGQWSTRAQQAQGHQEGLAAGTDPNYRPDGNMSIGGIARTNAAETTYGNMVEAQARTQLGNLYDQYKQLPPAQRDPARLQTQISALQDDFHQNHVFPQVQGQFDVGFGRIADSYLRQAQSDQDALQKQIAAASFMVNQNSAKNSAMQLASMPAADDAAIADVVRQHDASVDAQVAAGTYTPVQAVQMKSGFKQDVLSQRVLTGFENTPDAQKAAFLQNFKTQWVGQGGATPGAVPPTPTPNADGSITPNAAGFDTYKLYTDPKTGKPVSPPTAADGPAAFGDNPYEDLAPKPGYHWDSVAQKQAPNGGATPPGERGEAARALGGATTPAAATGPAANIDKSIPPEGRALLATIGGPEAGDQYNVRCGGATFDSYADHPRLGAIIASGPNAGLKSSAAGRYQFEPATWDAEAKKLGLTDFSPANQDKAAWDLARTTYKQSTGGDLLAALKSGDPRALAGVASSLKSQWTSLPGGIEQGVTSDAFARSYGAALNGAGKTAPTGDTHVDGLDFDTYAALENKMSARLRAVNGQAEHTQRLAVADIDGDLKQVEAGVPVDPAEWAAKKQEYGASPNPVVQQAFQTADGVKTMFDGFRGQTPAQVEAQVAAMRGQAAQGASPMQARMIEAGERYAKTLRSDFDRDPIGRATAEGIVKPSPPLDFSSPDKLAATLQTRAATADQIQQHYALPSPPMVTPDDREAVKQIAAAGGPPMVAAAQTIVRALGPRAADFLAQVGGDAPSFAHLGRLAAMGGDPGLMQDAAWAIQQDHQQGAKIQRPAPETLQQGAQMAYGDAFRALPDFAQGAKNVAGSALSAEIMREGLDPKALDPTHMAQTMQKAAGATFAGNVQYGGVGNYSSGWLGASSRVLLPSNLRADQIGGVIGQIQDADLKALPDRPVAADGKDIPADRLKGGYLTSVGPGVYAVSMGDPKGEDPRWVASPDGSRFLLDLNRMEPALRARLPGAYK